jgi:hypothetical protein
MENHDNHFLNQEEEPSTKDDLDLNKKNNSLKSFKWELNYCYEIQLYNLEEKLERKIKILPTVKDYKLKYHLVDKINDISALLLDVLDHLIEINKI